MVDSGKCPPGTDWLSIVKTISDLSTAESLWQVLNNVVPPSSLPINSTYHIFRKGIKPMWEDPKNVKGGKWVMQMPRGERNIKRTDEWWLYTVLAIVGETMGEDGVEVCGAVVSIRKVSPSKALFLFPFKSSTFVFNSNLFFHSLKCEVTRQACSLDQHHG